MYSFTSAVRFSEVDQKRLLSLSSVINYFQDCSTFHSEAAGLGFDYLEERHRVWLLSAWQVVITRLPAFGEEIVVSTNPYAFRSMYGYRNFLLADKNDNRLVTANSVWVYADTRTGRPVRVPAEDIEPYGLGERFAMHYADRKIALPQTFEELPYFSISVSQLDCNHHVNNGQYIRMAEACLPDGFSVAEFRADYRKAAHLSDIVVPRRTLSGDTCTIVLADPDGAPYTTVQFFASPQGEA